MKRNKIAVGASLVALGIGAGGLAVASPGTANRTQPAGPPQFVAGCLVKPETQRGACFAAAVGGHVPQFVARCLVKPEAQLGACFAAVVGANPGGGGRNPTGTGGGGNPTGTGGGGGGNPTGTGGGG